MNLKKGLALCLSAALTVSVLGGCRAADGTQAADGSTGTAAPLTTVYGAEDTANPRTPAAVDLTGATVITLSGASAAIDGEGVSEENGVITVSAAGTYVFSGTLTEGRILVDAKGQEVTLVLNGADITCSYGSPLYIYKAAGATVHLMEGTENSLTDGETYTFDDPASSAADEEPNACLYSKSDLVLQGAGALTVNANYNNGITGKDTLAIYDLTLTVRAANNGVNGKDSNTIDSASVTVNCGGDAIRSTNDTDGTLGYVSISNSTLDLTAGEDGIQAETTVTVSSGSYSIAAGGGSGTTPAEDISAKGIKGGSGVNLISGVYTIDCSDDAVHSNGDVTVSGGVYTVSSGDDAFHADGTLTVDGGELSILTSYEGLEGTVVNINGGQLRIVSSDDGVNAAGGADGSGFMGRGGGTFGSTDSQSAIHITGGYLVVNAGGDGLDANGSMTMTGGTVITVSSGRSDGAIDYDGSFALSGGTLLAVSGGAMPQAPSEATQNTVFIGFDAAVPADAYVALLGEGQTVVFEMPINTASVVYSSPDLQSGATYTVSIGGTYTGGTTDCICSGGAYSGGTELTQLTLTDSITQYGSTGMGGGMGGGAHGQMPAGEKPQQPDGGEEPQRPDGGDFSQDKKDFGEDGGFHGGRGMGKETFDGDAGKSETPAAG